jgi:hypothetical protein
LRDKTFQKFKFKGIFNDITICMHGKEG